MQISMAIRRADPLRRVYTASLNFGVSIGIIISGLITIDHSWRYIYYVATALIGGLTILVFFTMPETSYNRSPVDVASDLSDTPEKLNEGAAPPGVQHTKRTYKQSLRLFNGKFTHESFWKLFVRPIIMLILPPVVRQS